MSNHEWIAQVAQDKWATVSNLLRLLMINEQMSYSLKTFWLKSYFLVCFLYVFWFKEMSDLLIPSFLMSVVSELIRSLTKNKRCEQITQVAHQKWATMSDLFRGNERLWANHSGRSPKMSKRVNCSFFCKLLIRSFLGKKWVIRSENRWANSQPCMISQAIISHLNSCLIILLGANLLLQIVHYLIFYLWPASS